jgi:ATP-dependent Clp protease ATP-binding subunit ClpX
LEAYCVTVEDLHCAFTHFRQAKIFDIINGLILGHFYGSHMEDKKQDRKIGEILEQIETEDLLRYGLIPEFIGRVPVLATLHELDKKALVEILTKPKNAIIKQYQKFFSYENVRLTFTDESINMIAEEAIKRNSGARGLRAILENKMLDIMFELPELGSVKECVINEDVIFKNAKPILVYEQEAKTA